MSVMFMHHIRQQMHRSNTPARSKWIFIRVNGLTSLGYERFWVVHRGENKMAKRLLRLKPAAEYLSVSPATLRAIVQRGELSVIKLAETGHAPWLLDVQDLDKWIEMNKSTFD
jgi:excisionase family DNA binding protein